jgi:hypothetical protein
MFRRGAIQTRPFVPILVLLSKIIYATRANFSMRHSQEGGFQTRPYDSRFFLRFLRSLRPFFFCLRFRRPWSVVYNLSLIGHWTASTSDRP